MFMGFLTSLSIFGGKSPQERMQELVEIVEGQADLDSQFNVSFSCHILTGGGQKFLALIRSVIIIPPRCLLIF